MISRLLFLILNKNITSPWGLVIFVAMLGIGYQNAVAQDELISHVDNRFDKIEAGYIKVEASIKGLFVAQTKRDIGQDAEIEKMKKELEKVKENVKELEKQIKEKEKEKGDEKVG